MTGASLPLEMDGELGTHFARKCQEVTEQTCFRTANAQK